MTTPTIIALVVSLLSGAVAVTTLISFFTGRKEKASDRASEEATEKTKAESALDYIKLQNETIIAGNRNIADKLDNQNTRITTLETTVANARLAEIPGKISSMEASVKSAHKRIDDLVKR